MEAGEVNETGRRGFWFSSKIFQLEALLKLKLQECILPTTHSMPLAPDQ